jgi:hypothetical protein
MNAIDITFSVFFDLFGSPSRGGTVQINIPEYEVGVTRHRHTQIYKFSTPNEPTDIENMKYDISEYDFSCSKSSDFINQLVLNKSVLEPMPYLVLFYVLNHS